MHSKISSRSDLEDACEREVPPTSALGISQRASDFLRRMIVTIDGPAGSGKSTTAAILARRLAFSYLDTGSMYRAVALATIERGIDPEDSRSVEKLANEISVEVKTSGSNSTIYLDGRNVEQEIRSPEVSAAVSPVSKHPGVRRAMVRLQRRAGAGGGIVAEGRDTGSVVFPFADVRVFLTADVETRAIRRKEQLQRIGIEQSIEDIKSNIVARDQIDGSRETSPLVRPAGALEVDTSHCTIEEQVSAIEREVLSEAERLSKLAVMPGESDPLRRMKSYYRISHALVRRTMQILFGLKIRGSSNLRFRENFIFASNHRSYADPPIVGCALNREVWFLAKKELFRNKAFAALIEKYHAIPVDREELERSTIKRVLEILNNRGSILMFPEGTRSRTGELQELKPGLAYIAISSGVSIVPVYVSGTENLRDCFMRRRNLSVSIGRPIRVRSDRLSDDRKSEYRILTAMVASELEMLRDETED